MKTEIIFMSLVIGLLGNFISTSEASEPIRLLYNERPPYFLTASPGVVTGLTGTPASFAFQQLGIPHIWEKIPSIRQMNILQKNKGKVCLVGWFKNSAREKFSKYTKPIYRDKPAIGLALFSNINIESDLSLKDVLQNKKISLLVKKGYSYGKYIDDLIRETNPSRVAVSVENLNMVHMLKVERADYIFMAEEEANGLIRKANFSVDEFKFIRFSDMPAGNKRYILCSLSVEDSVIEKLNTWIEKYVSIQ